VEHGRELVSPKQVARAIGVSESSLKRWCDQGLISTVRTAGGHRKMPVADVLRFVRENGHTLASPEVLGLPPVGNASRLGLERGRTGLVEALLAGDEGLARQIVFDLHHAKHPLAVLCDEMIAAAFHDIGDRWACQTADVYQERRGCQIALRILFELRRLQPPPETSFPAIGGTVEGDQYVLPSAMAELVLQDAGFLATALGTSIPFPSLVHAVEETRPRLFWLSVSHVSEGIDFLTGFAALSRACGTTGTSLVVGGRALSADLLKRMRYAGHCASMQQLESFARNLRESLARPKSPRRGKVEEAGRS
jgi:methanogenic corrinoid protein MtbC1